MAAAAARPVVFWLRLEEAVSLHWTDESTGFTIDWSRARPLFWIRGFTEKGKKDRYLPMTPDFAQFLEQTPQCERRGYVFFTSSQDGKRRLTGEVTGKVISEIGKQARVKVGKGRMGGTKYASAHDLRRAYGERWSKRVSTRVLQVLMRHKDISTTEKFYLSRLDEAAVPTFGRMSQRLMARWRGCSSWLTFS